MLRENLLFRDFFKAARLSVLFNYLIFLVGIASAATLHRTARAAAGAAAFAGLFIFNFTSHEREDKKSYDYEDGSTDKHRSKLGFFKNI